MRSDIKERVDHQLYKVDSNARQRDEACRKTEALWHNMDMDSLLNWDSMKMDAKVFRAKAELERTILDLIIQRDR